MCWRAHLKHWPKWHWGVARTVFFFPTMIKWNPVVHLHAACQSFFTACATRWFVVRSACASESGSSLKPVNFWDGAWRCLLLHSFLQTWWSSRMRPGKKPQTKISTRIMISFSVVKQPHQKLLSWKLLWLLSVKVCLWLSYFLFLSGVRHC